jgi:hypothetical protein
MAAVAAFQHALMEARGVGEGSSGRAAALMQGAEARHGRALVLDGLAGHWASAASGYLALAQDRTTDALAAFERSAALAASAGAALTPRERIAARQRPIYAKLRLDRTAEAEREARSLAADAVRLLGADHPDTLVIRLNLAQALMVDQKHAAAVAEISELLPALERRFGVDHPRTLQALGSRMDALKSLERYPEARADGERLWRAAERRFGAESFYAVGTAADLARVRCRSGDAAGGLTQARVTLTTASAAFGAGHALAHGVTHVVAECLLAAGRASEAAPLLLGIDRRAVGELVGNAEWGRHVDLLLAESALTVGQADAARAAYERARPGFPDLLADAHEVRRLNGIERRLGLPLSRPVRVG